MTETPHAAALLAETDGSGYPNGTTPATTVPQQDLAAMLDGLERRLASQPVIEQSKGILMRHFGIDSDSAFNLLRRWSSHTNLKVRDISQMLVTTAAAGQRTDSFRTDKELAELIDCLNRGRRPTASS